MHNIIRKCIDEAYGKWFQTEENNIQQVRQMMNNVKIKLRKLNKMSPKQVWDVIRQLGYINHSAFKVKKGMWDLYPNEMLNNNDYKMNQLIYSFKAKALKQLVNYYLKNGLDVSTDANRSIIAFREPTTGVRQITFHMGNDNSLVLNLEKDTATWDGVPQAHHYEDDDSYLQKKLNLGESINEGRKNVILHLI